MTDTAKPASIKRATVIALVYPSLAFYYAGMSFFGALRIAVLLAVLSLASLHLPGHFLPWRTSWVTTFFAALAIFLGVAVYAVIYAKKHGANRPPRSRPKYIQFVVASILVSIPIAMLDDVPGVRTYRNLRETSESMTPTFVVGDRILVNLTAYESHPPAPGDLVAFNTTTKPPVIYVKRVAGVPGDRVAIVNKTLLRNSEPLSMLPPQDTESASPLARDFPEATVPEGHFFVVGDNLWNSSDSRHYGSIAREQIVGRAEAVLFSLEGTTIDPERIALDVK